ncbi:MAG: permease-like cell division protein FtsX [Pseudomonadota bacterium]
MAFGFSRRRRDPWPVQRGGISAWLRDHGRAALETLNFVSRRLGTSLLVWLLVGIALALPAGLYLLQVNLTAVGGAWEGRPGVSIYFDHGADPKLADALGERLQAQPGVALVERITPAEALEQFQAFGGLQDALDLVEDNPLPLSLRVVLSPAATADDLVTILRLAERADDVDEVVVEKTWLERVGQLSSLVRRLGSMLALLFGVGAVLVTASSVRLAIEARLEEVRVMKLVGASDAQLRRPFLYFGAYYGVGGAVVAAMLLSLALIVIEPPLTALLASYDQPLKTRGFDPTFLIVTLSIGLILGVTGALFAARGRLNRLDAL